MQFTCVFAKDKFYPFNHFNTLKELNLSSFLRQIIQRIRQHMVLRETADLSEWREWLSNTMFMIAVTIFPLAALISFPTLVNEKQYDIMALDFIGIAALSIKFFVKSKTFRFWAVYLICVLYIAITLFFLNLGPHYARSAWLVIASVIAALFFGARGAWQPHRFALQFYLAVIFFTTVQVRPGHRFMPTRLSPI